MKKKSLIIIILMKTNYYMMMKAWLRKKHSTTQLSFQEIINLKKIFKIFHCEKKKNETQNKNL
jgi:hypothetical protein